MSDNRHLPALFISLVCTILLACAFVLPFVESNFDLTLPGWIAAADKWIPGDAEAKLESWIIGLSGIPLGDQYLFGIIRDLWSNGDILLSVAIFAFSAVFPLVKLILALILSSGMPMEHSTRRRLQKVLEGTSKWSMADVFIAAMVVVFFKAEGFQFEFTSAPGIYCFAIAAIGSSVAVHLLKMELVRDSDSLGERVTRIAERLRAKGDADCLEMAEELEAVRGQVERAHYEA